MPDRPRPRRSWRRFAGDARGTTAIEFALLAVPFLGLTAAILDVGLGFFVERNLDAAVQIAARQIRTGALQAAAVVDGPTFLSKAVCPAAGAVLDRMIDCSKLIVDVRTSNTLTNNNMTNDFYKSPMSNQFCLGAPGAVTIVRVAYPMPWYFPVLVGSGVAQTAGLVNDVPNNAGWKLLLVSASAVKSEPYPAANYAAYQSAKGC